MPVFPAIAGVASHALDLRMSRQRFRPRLNANLCPDALKRGGVKTHPVWSRGKRGDLKGGERIGVREAWRLTGSAGLAGPTDRAPSPVSILDQGAAAADLANHTAVVRQDDGEQRCGIVADGPAGLVGLTLEQY